MRYLDQMITNTIPNVFEYDEAIPYLNNRIEAFPKRGHGIQRKLAKFLRCQSTYVSRVLKGRGQFSLEQASLISEFLAHTPEESHFFLLLVQKEKAGVPGLKIYFQKQIEEVLQKRLVLKTRLAVQESLSEADQVFYYSHWYISAIHIALTIPTLQTVNAISEFFRLPPVEVSKILHFLEMKGLARNEGGRYEIGITRIHLGSDSPLIGKSHINWRLQAIQSVERQGDRDLHYSSVISLSPEDIIKIKSDLVSAIEKTKAIIRASPAKELAVFSVDFFRLENL